MSMWLNSPGRQGGGGAVVFEAANHTTSCDHCDYAKEGGRSIGTAQRPAAEARTAQASMAAPIRASRWLAQIDDSSQGCRDAAARSGSTQRVPALEIRATT